VPCCDFLSSITWSFLRPAAVPAAVMPAPLPPPSIAAGAVGLCASSAPASCNDRRRRRRCPCHARARYTQAANRGSRLKPQNEATHGLIDGEVEVGAKKSRHCCAAPWLLVVLGQL